MANIKDYWRQGAMRGIELAASRRAVAEARPRWLPILEACARRDVDGGTNTFTPRSGGCAGCSACRPLIRRRE